MKKLSFANGQWKDLNNNNAIFTGRVGKDLLVGDQFEDRKTNKFFTVTKISNIPLESDIKSNFTLVESEG